MNWLGRLGRHLVKIVVCAWSHGRWHKRYGGLCGSVVECSQCGASWVEGS